MNPEMHMPGGSYVALAGVAVALTIVWLLIVRRDYRRAHPRTRMRMDVVGELGVGHTYSARAHDHEPLSIEEVYGGTSLVTYDCPPTCPALIDAQRASEAILAKQLRGER